MNQLDEAVEILGSYLERVRNSFRIVWSREAYRLILLIKVVDVSVQDLNKQFDGYRGVHASVGHPQRSLKTLQHTLAVPVELVRS